VPADTIHERLRRNEINNNQLLRELSASGCPIESEHAIDHAFLCPSYNLPALIEKLKEVGLIVDFDEATLPDQVVWISAYERATPKQMLERTRPLAQLAFDLGASYDGWGTLCHH
jgi:hypothetical protein